MLIKIEAILNSKPLTYVYEDFESGFVLTPSHFLLMNRKHGLPQTGDDYFKDTDYQPDKKFNNTIINRLEERPETFAFTLESMKRGVFT